MGNANSGRRKPVALRAYEGNRSKTALPKELDYRVAVPQCPSWMPPIGREYWAHITAEISPIPGLLRAADRGVLEQICKKYDEWLSFTDYCDRNDWTYKVQVPYAEGGEGEGRFMWKPRPEARFAKEAGLEFARLRGELGLSPTARVRLAVPAPKKTSSLLDAG